MFFNMESGKRNNFFDWVDDTIREDIEYFFEEELFCNTKQARKGQKGRNMEESGSKGYAIF